MSKLNNLLIVLGRGGHTEQLIKVVRTLKSERFNCSYVVAKDDYFSESKIELPGKIYWISNPRKMDDKNLFLVIFKMVPSFLDAFRILLESNADCIIACGPGLCVPLIILGKLFGKKIIFIESWSRVYTKSLSGRVSYPFSNLFFVQWPELKKKYPKSIYAGRLS